MTMLSTLEVLKTEAADVGQKVDETDQVMADIENTSKQYLPLSAACSHIYFTIESLHQVHFLYQFSLQFFLDIYHSLLTKDQRLDGMKDPAQRLTIITSNLYSTCYERVTRGMLHEDRLLFALHLTRIYLKSAPGELPMDPEFKVLLRGGEKGGIGQLAPIPGLTDEQTVAVYRLANSLPAFKDLVSKCTNPALATWLSQRTICVLFNTTPIVKALDSLREERKAVLRVWEEKRDWLRQVRNLQLFNREEDFWMLVTIYPLM